MPVRSAGLRSATGCARSGFTLVELAIALAIGLVLTLIGWTTMQSYLPRFRMVKTAKALRSDLVHLQSLAMQTGRETRLKLVSAGGECTSDRGAWGGSWRLEIGNSSRGSTKWELLPPDAGEDGTDDDQSEGVVDIGEGGNREAREVCLEQWSSLAGPATGNADSIVFSPEGWLSNPATDFNSSGIIRLTFANQVAGRQGVNDEISLTISRAGMVRLESTLGADQPAHLSGTALSSSK